MNAREEILGRVRTALAGSTDPGAATRNYRRVTETADVAPLLCQRLADYKAEVHRLSATEILGATSRICAAHRIARLGVPAELRNDWRPDSVEVVEDHGLSPRELDGLDGVLTACTLAIAETGTLVLAAGPEEGRRALTLVPDVHICVVRASQIVDGVPTAFAALGRLATRPLTFVSGPSATSDIELSRVEGVHGPRTLVVLIAG